MNENHVYHKRNNIMSCESGSLLQGEIRDKIDNKFPVIKQTT